jgi:rhamnopyranosyl-N-acetylglucosaminyl-diphospho-decaprenol beta-1,3/1,4-galactofuranosyltransferase
MRILAHIHTLNDEAVIEQALDGLRRQTRRPDAIVIVDNGSSDDTLNRTFPDNVTIIRHRENLGTSGAIRAGLAHALKHEFDWTWIFDADSVPAPDALEKLLAAFELLPPSEREQVCFLACRLENAENEVRHEPMIFAGATVRHAPVNAGADRIRCDYFIWTGSLFQMKAVAKIGLPSADYVLDVAEVEYGYRARQAGFIGYVIPAAVTHQDVGRSPGIVVSQVWNIGRWQFALREVSPIRAYYATRNQLYFWLHQYRPRRPRRVLRALILGLLSPVGFAVRPATHHRQLIASLRGLWDGLTARIERRY